MPVRSNIRFYWLWLIYIFTVANWTLWIRLGKLVNVLYRQRERTYPNSDLGKRFNKQKSEKKLNFLNCIFHGSCSQKIWNNKKKTKKQNNQEQNKTKNQFWFWYCFNLYCDAAPYPGATWTIHWKTACLPEAKVVADALNYNARTIQNL